MKGEGTVFPKAGRSFDPALIPKAIHDAGFTATEVEVVVDGTLAASNGTLELDVPGLKRPFVLAGGPEEASLKKQVNLVGKKIQVTGKVIEGHGGSHPTLTVETSLPLN
ncbi:MAG: hypothetical protein EPN47_18260 [Acidobacteria bacterium]|nr:MAG: hypothetical protein EPN47_18260 [Acidobacteriota bacterium]